jgi:hypothetical protein
MVFAGAVSYVSQMVPIVMEKHPFCTSHRYGAGKGSQHAMLDEMVMVAARTYGEATKTMRWSRSAGCVLAGLLGISGGCAAVPPCPLPETGQLPSSQAPSTTPEGPVSASLATLPTPPSTLALERKVKLQEKRIAELSSQLRMLKRIDLDRSKQ